jgi:hypothetical protein
MNKSALILSGLTLSIAIASAADYHLVQMQMEVDHQSFTAYALFLQERSQAQIFKQFYSKAMKERLASLPRGSVVYYDADRSLPKVPKEQLDSLERSCQTNGIRFIVSGLKRGD